MTDFKNTSFLKLSPISPNEGLVIAEPLLVDGEEIFAVYKAGRDIVIFTNKRVITINVQGITGTKRDFTSLPYSRVQAYSIETSGTLTDSNCELELWCGALGKVKFEFKNSFDVKGFSKLLAPYIF